jgi:hypothetical protein
MIDYQMILAKRVLSDLLLRPTLTILVVPTESWLTLRRIAGENV